MYKSILVLLNLITVSLAAQVNYCSNKIVNTSSHDAAIKLLQSNTQQKSATLVIPVVFHIVYNSSVENVPDSIIIKQMNQLNADFRRTNADTANTPAPFKGVATSMDIQFCFANTTPTGAPTNGINRIFTNKTFFNAPPNYTTIDSLKHTNLGGADAWNTSIYLNIWVANVTNLSGYAAPPSNMIASEDGVGINYKTLGTSNSTPPYNKFRTVTHEVGHFFGLKHIWGDDGNACTGTDYMNDTPDQAGFTPGQTPCQTFPRYDACTATGNGVMFMNYMDYSSDVCRNLFTVNQVNYMNATINCCRQGFLNTSLTDCNTAVSDEEFFIKDAMKLYPNPNNGNFTIELDSEVQVVIYNALGQVIYFNESQDQRTEISISDYAKGIYLIQALDKGNIKRTEKIIVTE